MVALGGERRILCKLLAANSFSSRKMQLLRKREVTERLKKNASKIIVGAGIDSNPARLYFDSL